MAKHTATEAMNLFESALRSQPDVMALHVGFFKEKSVLIVSGPAITPEVESRLQSVAPGAPLKLIQTTSGQDQPTAKSCDELDAYAHAQMQARKQLSPQDALKIYGKKIKAVKTVSSVDVGRRAGRKVLVVRAFPLTDALKANVRAMAPEAQIRFQESRHPKVSTPSVVSFVVSKLKVAVLILAVLGIVIVAFSPLYTAMADIKFALGASTANGVVVKSERPIANPQDKSEITQEVTIEFPARGQEMMFTTQAVLFKTLGDMGNMNASPYHKGMAVSVAYDNSNPVVTARIFDGDRFWVTLALYLITVLCIIAISITTWKKWEEW